MQLLIDNNPVRVAEIMQAYDFVGGQLLTPLTRNSDAGGFYAIDNGAFSGFDRERFASLLTRQSPFRDRCLFVAMPDVVGSARRTLEAFQFCYETYGDRWKLALVAQDGIEDLGIPWGQIEAMFIGGTTEWKMSEAAAAVVKAAKIMGKHVHIGRINTPERWLHFEALGADTCDGSGVSRYDHMLDAIQNCRFNDKPRPLFIGEECGREKETA